MLVLVQSKRVEFIQEVEADDPCELMDSKMTKWEKISLSVNVGARISCYYSPEACKYKWQTLLLEYKHVTDLYIETGTNSILYFELLFK